MVKQHEAVNADAMVSPLSSAQLRGYRGNWAAANFCTAMTAEYSLWFWLSKMQKLSRCLSTIKWLFKPAVAKVPRTCWHYSSMQTLLQEWASLQAHHAPWGLGTSGTKMRRDMSFVNSCISKILRRMQRSSEQKGVDTAHGHTHVRRKDTSSIMCSSGLLRSVE